MTIIAIISGALYSINCLVLHQLIALCIEHPILPRYYSC